VGQLDDLGADNPLEPVQHDAGTQTFKGSGPPRSIAQAHRIVVPICVAKAQKQTPGGLEPEGVDDFLPHQAHRGRAQEDDTLFMQANDPLIRLKIQELSEMVRFDDSFGGDGRFSFHANQPVHFMSGIDLDPSLRQAARGRRSATN